MTWRVAGKPLEKSSDHAQRRMKEFRSGSLHGKTEHRLSPCPQSLIGNELSQA